MLPVTLLSNVKVKGTDRESYIISEVQKLPIYQRFVYICSGNHHICSGSHLIRCMYLTVMFSNYEFFPQSVKKIFLHFTYNILTSFVSVSTIKKS